jgi:hypothetical protein
LRPTALVHTMSNLLNSIENSGAHIENLKTQVIKAKKVQLHSGLQGFESPDSFGVYRNNGGAPLGVVGKQFEPCNLELFLDAIQHSVLSSGIDCDLTKLEYKEYYGGSKVGFKLPYKTFEIATPMVGDILQTSLDFRTGFDGKTKMSIGFSSLRLFCTNGAKNWKKDIELCLKNTTNNQAKMLTFTNEVVKAANETENYVQFMNMASLKSIKQSQIDAFLATLTGYSVKEYSDLTTRKRNILDSINRAIAIEVQNTSATYFSLLQGITRYTTHELAKGDMDSVMYGHASQMNERAHQLIFAELN